MKTQNVTNLQVSTETSLRTSGNAYVPAQAAKALDVGKDDEVAVTFPKAGDDGEDLTVRGFINYSNKFYTGRPFNRRVIKNTGNEKDVDGHYTSRIPSIIQATGRRWEDDKVVIDNRWDNVFSIAANVL